MWDQMKYITYYRAGCKRIYNERGFLAKQSILCNFHYIWKEMQIRFANAECFDMLLFIWEFLWMILYGVYAGHNY